MSSCANDGHGHGGKATARGVLDLTRTELELNGARASTKWMSERGQALGGTLPSARWKAGDLFGGKYRLVATIGRGGGGDVWRGEHVGWQTPVAIKIANVDGSGETRARFEREVRIGASLRSPHVVQVLDQGVEERTNTPFLVMELLEGETLAQRLQRSGRLGLRETLELLEQAGRALSFAHSRGILHRDVKPSNIFIAQSGDQEVVKILDFGVAKPASKLEPALTEPGSVLGTPEYMSPEQARGCSLDQRADVWSLAVIACECVTGCSPFDGGDLAQIFERLLDVSKRPPPSWLGPVPDGFDRWFAQATCAKIGERYQSVKQLLRALVLLEPIRQTPRGPEGSEREPTLLLPTREGAFHDRARAEGDQRPVLSARTAGALLLMIGIAGAIGWRATGQRERLSPASRAPEIATVALRQSPGQGPPAAAEQPPRESANPRAVGQRSSSAALDAGSLPSDEHEHSSAMRNASPVKPSVPRRAPPAPSDTARRAVVHPAAPSAGGAPKSIVINGHKIWTSLDTPGGD